MTLLGYKYHLNFDRVTDVALLDIAFFGSNGKELNEYKTVYLNGNEEGEHEIYSKGSSKRDLGY